MASSAGHVPIEVGKYADLLIFEKSRLDMEASEIADTKVPGTIMDGSFTSG